MRELSLNILDIVMNSIEAGATRVITAIVESPSRNLLQIAVRDNGRGMSDELARSVLDPFVTTRTTRAVGMGLPLFRQTALQAGGDLKIDSQIGKGTTVIAFMQLNNLNRPPLGNIVDTMMNLMTASPNVHFFYAHLTDGGRFCFDSFRLFSIMAEHDCSIYEAADRARQNFENGLRRIGARLF